MKQPLWLIPASIYEKQALILYICSISHCTSPHVSSIHCWIYEERQKLKQWTRAMLEQFNGRKDTYASCCIKMMKIIRFCDKNFRFFRLLRILYRISGIFRVGLIFAEFATSLKSPKIDTAKNKLYFTSLLRVLELAKIWLGENLTHLPSVIFAKISRREKFLIYGI